MKERLKKFFDKSTTLATLVLMLFSAMPLSVGAAPEPPAPEMPYVMISEIMAAPYSGESEWVELWVPGGDNVVCIDGWTLKEISAGVETELVTFGNINIPANGYYVYQIVGSKLNNNGDSVSLWDDTGQEIYRFSWTEEAWRSGEDWPYLPDVTPDPGTSFSFLGVDFDGSHIWGVTDPTEGGPNFGGPGDEEPFTPFDQIAMDLSEIGIETNLGEFEDYTNVTGLYFEVVDPELGPLGRITFTNSLDLTNPDVLEALGNLEEFLDFDSGRVGLSSELAELLGAAGGQITMYNLPFATIPGILVFDDMGLPVSLEDIHISIISYVPNGNGGFDLTFTVDHFTTFVAVTNTKPTTPVPITSGVVNGTDLTLDWEDSIDPDGPAPIGYKVQIATSDAVKASGAFSTGIVEEVNWDDGLQVSSYTLTNDLPEGTYYWHVRAADAIGSQLGSYPDNRSEWSETVTLIVDNTNPEVNLDDPSAGYVRGIVDVIGTVMDENLKKTVVKVKNLDNDDDPVTIFKNKTGTQYDSEKITEWDTTEKGSNGDPLFKDGNYKVILKGFDKAGNVAIDLEKPVTVDNTRPESTVNDLGAYYNTETINITFTSSDNLSGVDYIELYYRKDSGEWTPYLPLEIGSDFEAFISEEPRRCGFAPDEIVQFDTSLTGGDGFYEFYANAVDKAGNFEHHPSLCSPILDSNVEENFVVNIFRGSEPEASTIVDTIAPVITLNGDNPMEIYVGDTYVEPGATTSDGSEVVISGNVDTETPGTYTILYNSTDDAGNAAVEVSRTVNVVEPPAPLTPPTTPTTPTTVASDVGTDEGGEVLGETEEGTDNQNQDNNGEVAGEEDQGESDENNDKGKVLGLMWYWWLLILVLLVLGGLYYSRSHKE